MLPKSQLVPGLSFYSQIKAFRVFFLTSGVTLTNYILTATAVYLLPSKLETRQLRKLPILIMMYVQTKQIVFY